MRNVSSPYAFGVLFNVVRLEYSTYDDNDVEIYQPVTLPAPGGHSLLSATGRTTAGFVNEFSAFCVKRP